MTTDQPPSTAAERTRRRTAFRYGIARGQHPDRPSWYRQMLKGEPEPDPSRAIDALVDQLHRRRKETR
jgi:hypothetical protein